VYGHSFDVGVAIPGRGLTPKEQALIVREFTAVTPENCMKPTIHRSEKDYSFSESDALVAFAARHGLKVNAHTLIWHEHCPAWFFEDNGMPAGRDLCLARMRSHIATMVGRYRGRVFSHDVVNEALSPDDAEYLRPNQWLAAIGPDYVVEAFRAAAQADSGARLLYNDYGIESPVKRAKAVRLIREIRAAGVPVHGIGIQGHWELDRVPFRDIEDSINAFHAEGLEVMITELDIDVVPRHFASPGVSRRGKGATGVVGPLSEVLTRQAEQYARLFRIFEANAGKISRVTFWGLHDGRSWLNSWPQKRKNHPLLWDRKLRPKPANAAVTSAGPPAAG
jgi:endo-1,4-beta-xylanase